MTEGIDARARRFDAACREAGRDPASIRRSTWAGAEVAASEDAYLEFVRHHRGLGFTDFMTVLPGASDLATLRRIARDRIPELRSEFGGVAG